MFKSIGVLASLAVTAAMFVGASSAQAATGDVAVCVFSGLTGNLLGPLPNLDQPGAITVPPISAPLTGTYTFNGRGNCAGYDQTSGQVVTPVIPPATNTTITSAGSYANFVCGTGTAHDAADPTQTTVNPDQAGVADVKDVGYDIVFAAGVGALVIGTSGSYVGAGAVHITPNTPFPLGPGGNCVSDLDAVLNGTVTDGEPEDRVDRFTVDGAFGAVGL